MRIMTQSENFLKQGDLFSHWPGVILNDIILMRKGIFIGFYTDNEMDLLINLILEECKFCVLDEEYEEIQINYQEQMLIYTPLKYQLMGIEIFIHFLIPVNFTER